MFSLSLPMINPSLVFFYWNIFNIYNLPGNWISEQIWILLKAKNVHKCVRSASIHTIQKMFFGQTQIWKHFMSIIITYLFRSCQMIMYTRALDSGGPLNEKSSIPFKLWIIMIRSVACSEINHAHWIIFSVEINQEMLFSVIQYQLPTQQDKNLRG